MRNFFPTAGDSSRRGAKIKALMMTLADYLRKKEERARDVAVRRGRCVRCRRPATVCYCASIRAFSPAARFVILMHRNEARRGIASGRMAHLCLTNSELWQGTDFTEDERVNG